MNENIERRRISPEQFQPAHQREGDAPVRVGPQFGHLAGHFPTLEEIARLEKLERRRAQKREAFKRWRERHPQQHSDKVGRWQAAHREQVARYHAEWYRQNKEKRPKPLDADPPISDTTN